MRTGRPARFGRSSFSGLTFESSFFTSDENDMSPSLPRRRFAYGNTPAFAYAYCTCHMAFRQLI